MKNLTELRFWLIGYGLSLKDIDKIMNIIKERKE
jgi:hypothetical protein